MAKKHRLESSSVQEFAAFGLASGEKDYRLGYFIGKRLDILLDRSAQIFYLPAGQKIRQSADCYYYQNEDLHRKMYFFRNRHENGYIIPSLRQVDFFILLYSLPEDNFGSELKKSLADVPNIQTIFAVPPEYLKHLDVE